MLSPIFTTRWASRYHPSVLWFSALLYPLHWVKHRIKRGYSTGNNPRINRWIFLFFLEIEILIFAVRKMIYWILFSGFEKWIPQSKNEAGQQHPILDFDTKNREVPD
jgi:heme/copper-type cytochrome/quinol oxidase subunit 3